MRVKMLLMAWAVLFKASHRPQACSRPDPIPAWLSFPHVGEGKESRPSQGNILCLLCKSSRLRFQSLMWKNNDTARCGWWATQGAGWSGHSMALPVRATRVLLPLVPASSLPSRSWNYVKGSLVPHPWWCELGSPPQAGCWGHMCVFTSN